MPLTTTYEAWMIIMSNLKIKWLKGKEVKKFLQGRTIMMEES